MKKDVEEESKGAYRAHLHIECVVGQQLKVWVNLENGPIDAVKIVDTDDVAALRDAIKMKFAPKLDAYAAADLVVKLSKDAEPLDPEALLSEVFKDVATGKLRVYVELPKIEGPTAGLLHTKNTNKWF